MPQGIQVIRLFLISSTLQTRAHYKYPRSWFIYLFPQPASGNRWKKPSTRMTSYFNISCPNVPGSLTLKQMVRKSLWNSKRPQREPLSHFLCRTPEHYFQHCSSTALPDLCLHKLMSGTYKGARRLWFAGNAVPFLLRVVLCQTLSLSSTKILE